MSRAAAQVVISFVLLACSADGPTDSGASDVGAPDVASSDGTTSPAASLTLTPSTVFFGEVAGAATKVLSVLAVNDSDFPANVAAITISGSPDFRVLGAYDAADGTCQGFVGADARSLPFEVLPSGVFCIDVEYQPFGGGPNEALLAVLASATGDGAPLGTATLLGSEVNPELGVNPTGLNFGPVAVGESRDLTFTITNHGQANLVIEGVSKGESNLEIFDAISIVTTVPAGTVVAPGEMLEVVVSFAPLQVYPVTYSTIGFVEVFSNDTDEPIAYVKVSAQTTSGFLQVTPSPVIDFGLVAENTAGSTRTFILTNVGTGKLEVTGLTILNNPAGEFTIDEVVLDPIVLSPNSYRLVTLRYVNTGGPEGQVEEALLTFAASASDASTPTSVGLRATRTKIGACAIRLEPEQVNFGAVGYGLQKAMTLNVVNVGSAPCSPFSVSIGDGPSSVVPVPGESPMNCTIPAGDESEIFHVTMEPPAIVDLLQPGESLPLEITYSPTSDTWSSISLDGLTPFTGIVRVVMLDYANPNVANGTDYTVVAIPPGDLGDEVLCNLSATAGVSDIAVFPTEVDFAATTVGCFSKTQDVKLTATGVMPVDICGIELQGCSDEVTLKNVPTIPACLDGTGGIQLTQGSPLSFGVVHVPEDASFDGCAIAILTSDAELPVLTVPLAGKGTTESVQTDTFTQLSGGAVDVLLVIDDNLALTQTPDHLTAEFNALAALVEGWSPNTHVGVIASNTVAPAGQPGRLAGAPRFVTGGKDGSDTLALTLDGLGTPGAKYGAGLDALWSALSFPLSIGTDPSSASCSTDDDCAAPFVCVPSVLESGVMRCTGWNWEFFREDAALEVLFISDDEDGSGGNLSFYIDFLKNIKGAGEAGLVRAHAVVGDSGSGCESSNGKAFAGDRYIEVAKQLGGQVRSICASNWASVFSKGPTSTFGLDAHFALSRPPIPETIMVEVAGSACTAGWGYLEHVNAILFDQNHPCMPKENETIEITYHTLCYSE